MRLTTAQKRRCGVPGCRGWSEHGADRCYPHRGWRPGAQRRPQIGHVDPHGAADPFSIDDWDPPADGGDDQIVLDGDVEPGAALGVEHTHRALFADIDGDGPHWKAQVVDRVGAHLRHAAAADPDLAARLDRVAQRWAWDHPEKAPVRELTARRASEPLDGRDLFAHRYAQRLVDGWAEGGPDPYHHFIQARVADRVQGVGAGEEYLSAAAAYDPEFVDAVTEVRAHLDDEAPLIDAALDGIYADTQADLAARGITRVQVARGMGWEIGTETPPQWAQAAWDHQSSGVTAVDFRPMSSWTTRIDTAEGFAHGYLGSPRVKVLVFADVPASHVLCTPRTGLGCWDEQEVVVMANQPSRVTYEGLGEPDEDWLSF